jgi:hypothetical protein
MAVSKRRLPQIKKFQKNIKKRLTKAKRYDIIYIEKTKRGIKMTIEIHLKIEENVINDICATTGKTREDVVQAFIDLMEADMGQTIQDNEEFFSEQTFEIE